MMRTCKKNSGVRFYSIKVETLTPFYIYEKNIGNTINGYVDKPQ
jgi:hypothetical protein